LGGFIGASIGSLLLVQLKDPQLHMLVVSFFVVISTLILAKQYDRIIETTAPKTENTKPSLLKNIKPVLGLSVIAFIILFNEGAVEHWSNLFLFDVVNVTQENAGIGFVVFSLTMTIGRFLGDGISNTIGPNKTLTYGCLIALFAYLLILTTSFYTSVLGYAFLGLGLSVIIPEIFRFAGKSKGINTSVAISIVSGIGFVGFLIGPVLLGFIANSSSLIISYMVLLGLTFVAFLILQFRIKRKYA
jgi:Fucose permease